MKRLFRIGLRTLLVLVLVCGAACGWIVNSISEFESEQLARIEVLKQGLYKPSEVGSLSNAVREKVIDQGLVEFSTSYM